MGDVEIQMLEQQRLIEQLKDMIRERDEEVKKKDTELKEVNAKLSKLKLQAKAKQAKEAKDAREGKLTKFVAKKDPEESTEQREEVAADNEDTHSQPSRAKLLLMKKKVEEKDRIIREKDETVVLKDQQIEVKEKIIAEREEIITGLTKQLEDKTKLMEELQVQGPGDGSEDSEMRVQQMYAQIVYKDKNLLELNNKILELERRLIDLQEFVEEKNEVIRGRDKVIEILQSTIKEKDENVSDQAMLITKLTAKVETNDEVLTQLREQVEKADRELKQERERFNIRLIESQKYFEETLKEQEDNIAKLKKTLTDRERALLTAENDLAELISRHERDIQQVMSKSEVNLQDSVIQMLEQKVKDTNEVLEGKIKVIEMLQKDASQKDKDLEESIEIQKNFKEKLQNMSEQMMLSQASLADMESYWKEEKQKYESKIAEIVEKHEHETTEKEMQIQSLKSSSSQLEIAYSQSAAQYSSLQERYHQLVSQGGAGDATDSVKTKSDETSGRISDQNVDVLKSHLKARDQEIEELICFKQKYDSLSEMLREKHDENEKLKKELDKGAETSDSAKSGGAKMMKVKAQLTARVKALEKELIDLKKAREEGTSESENLGELKAQISQKQLEVESLTHQLTTARETVEQQETVLEQLKGEKVSLEVKAAEAEEQTEALERMKADLEIEVERLKKTMAEDMQQPLIDIETERDALRQTLTEANTALESATSLSNQQKDEINSLTSQLQVTENAISELETEIVNLRERSALTLKQVQELEVEKQAEIDRSAALEGAMNSVKASLDNAESSRKQQAAQLESQSEQIEHLHARIEATTAHIEHYESVINTKEESHRQKTEELQQVKENVFSLQNEISSFKDKLYDIEKETHEFLSVFTEDVTSLGYAKTLVENLYKSNETIEKLSEEYSEEIVQLKKEKDELGLQLEESCVAKAELKSAMNEYELQVIQLQREMEAMKEGQTMEGEALETKIQTLLRQMSDQEKQYLDLRTENEEKTACLTRLNDENKTLKEKNDTVLKQCADAESKLSEMKSESKELNDKLLEAKTTCDDLKKKHSEDNSEMELTIKSLKEEHVQLKLSAQDLNSLLEKERAHNESMCSDLEEKILSLESLLSEEKKIRSVAEEKQNALQGQCDSNEKDLLAMKSELESVSINLKLSKEMCSKHEDSVGTLTSENKRLNQLLFEIEGKDSDLSNRLSELENSASVSYNECELLKEKNACLTSQVSLLEEKLKVSEECLEVEKSKLGDVEDESVKLKEELSKRSSEIEVFSKDNKILVSEKLELLEAISNFNNEISAINDKLVVSESTKDDLRQTISSVNDEKQSLQAQISDLTSQLEQRENSIIEMEKKISEILSEHQSELEKVTCDNSEQLGLLKDKHMEELELLRQESDRQLDLLRQELKAETVEQQCKTAEQLNQLQMENKDLMSQVSAIQHECDRKHEILSARMNECDSLHEHVSSLQKSLSELESSHVSLQKECSELHTLASDLSNKNEVLSQHVVQLSNENEKLGHKKAKLEDEVIDLHEEVKKTQHGNASLKTEVSFLQTTLSSKCSEIENLSCEMASVKKTMIDLTDEYNSTLEQKCAMLKQKGHETNSLKQDLDSNISEAKELQQKIQILQELLEVRDAENNSLLKTNLSKDQDHIGLQYKIDLLTNELHKLQSDNSSVQSELEKQRTYCNALHEDNKSLHDENSVLNMSIDKLKHEHQVNVSEIRAETAAIQAHLEHEKSLLQQEIEKEKLSVVEKDAIIDESEMKLSHLEESFELEVEKYTTEIADFSTQHKALTQSVNKITMEKEELLCLNKSLQEELRDVKQNCVSFQDKTTKFSEKIRELETVLETERLEKGNILLDLREATTLLGQKESSINNLISSHEQCRSESESALKEMETKLGHFQKTVDSLQVNMSAKEKENEALKSELQALRISSKASEVEKIWTISNLEKEMGQKTACIQTVFDRLTALIQKHSFCAEKGQNTIFSDHVGTDGKAPPADNQKVEHKPLNSQSSANSSYSEDTHFETIEKIIMCKSEALKELKNELEEMTSKNARLENILDQLQDRLGDREYDLSKLADRHSKLETNFNVLEESNDKLKREIASLVLSNTELEEKLQASKSDLDLITQAKGELEKQLEQTLVELRSSWEKLNQEMTYSKEIYEKHNHLEDCHQDLKVCFDEMKIGLVTATEKLESSESKLNVVLAEAQLEKKQVTQLCKEVSHWKECIDDLAGENDELRQRLSHAESAIEDLETEMQSKIIALASVESDNAKHIDMCQNLSANVDILLEANKELRHQKQSLDSVVLVETKKMKEKVSVLSVVEHTIDNLEKRHLEIKKGFPSGWSTIDSEVGTYQTSCETENTTHKNLEDRLTGLFEKAAEKIESQAMEKESLVAMKQSFQKEVLEKSKLNDNISQQNTTLLNQIKCLEESLKAKDQQLFDQENQMSLLENQISEYQKNLKSLSEMNADLEDTVELVRKECKQLTVDLTEYQEQIGTLNTIKNELEAQNATWKLQAERLQKKVEEKKNELEQYETEKSNALIEFETVNNQVKSLQENLSEKDSEISNLANNIQELQSNLQKVKEERDLKIELLSENVTDLVSQMDLCNSQKEEIVSELNDVISNLENTEASRDELENKLKTANFALADKEETLSKFNQQHDMLRQQFSEMSNLLTDAEKGNAEKDSTIEKLTMEKQEHLLMISNAQKRINLQSSEIEGLKNERDQLQELNEEMSKDSECKNDEISVLKSTVEELQYLVNDSKLETERLAESLHCCKRELQEKLAEMNNLQSLIEEHTKDKEVTNDLLKDKRDQIDILQAEILKLRTKNESLMSENKSLMCDTTKLLNEIERYEERVDEASTKELELKGFLDEFSRRIEEISEEKESLHKLAESLETAKQNFKEWFNNEKEAHRETKYAIQNLMAEHTRKEEAFSVTQKAVEEENVLLKSKLLMSEHTVRQLTERTDSLELNVEELYEQLNVMKLEKQDLNKAAESIKSEKEGMEQQLLEQYQWVSELGSKCDIKGKLLQEKDKKLQDTDKRLIMVSSQLQDLQQQYRIALEKVETLENEKHQLLLQCKDTERLIAMKETEIDSIVVEKKVSVLQMKESVQALNQELEDKNEQVNELSKDNYNLKMQLKNAEVKSLAVVVGLETEIDSLNLQLQEKAQKHADEIEKLKNEEQTKTSFDQQDCDAGISGRSDSELEMDITTLLQQMDVKDEDIQRLKETVSHLEVQLTVSADSIESLKKQYADKIDLITDLEDEIWDLKQVNDKLNDVLEISQKDTMVVSSDLTEAKAESERMSLYAEKCEEKIKDLQTEYRVVTDKLRSHERLYTALETANCEKVTENNQLTELLADKENKVDIVCSEYARLSEEALSDKSVLSHMMIELSSVKKKFTCLIDSVVDKDKVICSQNEKIHKLEMSLQSCSLYENQEQLHSAMLHEKHKEIEMLNGKIDDLTSEIEVREMAEMVVKSQYQHLNGEYSALRGTIKAFQEENLKLKMQIKDFENLLSERDLQIEYVLKSSDSMTESIARKDTELLHHGTEVERLKTENIQQSSILQTVISERDELLRETQDMKSENKMLRKEAKELKTVMHEQELLQTSKCEILQEELMKEMNLLKTEKSMLMKEKDMLSLNARSMTASFSCLVENLSYLTKSLAREHWLDKSEEDVNYGDLLGSEIFKRVPSAQQTDDNIHQYIQADCSTSVDTKMSDIFENLVEGIDMLKQTVKHSNSMHICLQGEHDKVVATLREHKDKTFELEKQLAVVTEKLSVSEQALSQYKKENALLMGQTENLQVSKKTVERMLHETEVDLKTVTLERDNLREKIDTSVLETDWEMENKLSIISVKMSELDDKLVSLGASFSRTLLQSKLKQQKIFSLQTDIETLQKEREDLKKLLNEMTDNEELLISAKKEIEAKYEENRTQIIELTDKIENLCSEIEENSQMYQQLQSEKDLNETAYQQQINQFHGEISYLSADIDSKTKEIDKLEQSIEHLTSQLKDHQTDLPISQEFGNNTIEPNTEKEVLLVSEIENIQHIDGTRSDTKAGEEDCARNKDNVVSDDNLVCEMLAPITLSSLNSSFSSVSSEKEPTASNEIQDLNEKNKILTEERNKFKADNKKLIKIGKGKDTKLRLMNESFEKLRKERDELLSDRDTLENKVQDLTTSFVEEYGGSKNIELEVKCAELETLCREKEKDIEKLTHLLDEKSLTQPESKYCAAEISALSKENEKLRVETAKLQMIDKGKSAKIHQLNRENESMQHIKENELLEKVGKIQEAEELLTAERLTVSQLKDEQEKMKVEQVKLQKLNKGKEAKLKKLEEKISNLENEIENKMEENTKLQDSIKYLEKKVEDLNKNEEELRYQFEQNFKQTKEIEQQLSLLGDKAKESELVVKKKETEIQSLGEREALVKQLREEKIILEFELECAKEELEKLKGTDEDGTKFTNTTEDDESIADDRKGDVDESNIEGEEVDGQLTNDDLKKKLALLNHDNKKLIKEKSKLQKIGKGKEARLKKVETIVKEQQNTIAEKETDIFILKENINEFHSKVDMLEEIEQDLRYKLDNAMADVDELRDQCQDLEDQLDSAHEALDRKMTIIYRLEDNLVASRDDIENLCVERDEMERQRDEVSNELQIMKASLEKKEDSIDNLKSKLQEVQSEKENAMTEIRKLQKVSKGKEAKIKKFEEMFSSMENSSTETQSQVTYLQNELQNSLTSMQKVVEQNQQFQNEVKQNEEVKQQLEYQNFQLSNQLSETKADLQQQTESINVLKDEIGKLNLHCRSLQVDVEEKDSSLQKMNDIATAWERKCMDFEISNQSFNDTLSQRDSEIQNLSSNVCFLEESVNQMKESIEKSQAKIISLENHCSEIMFSLTAAENSQKLTSQENHALKLDLEEKQSLLHDCQQRCSSCESQCQDYKQVLQEKSEHISIYQTKLEFLEQQLEHQNTSLNERAHEVQSLKHIIESSSLSTEETRRQFQNDLGEWKRLLKEKEDENVLLCEKMNSLRNDLKKTMMEKETKVKKFNQMLSEKETSIAALKALADQHANECKDVISEQEKEHLRLKETIETLNNELRIVLTEQEAKSNEVDQSLQEKESSLAELKTLSEQRIAELESFLVEKEGESSGLKEKVDELSNDLNKALSEKEIKNSEVNKLLLEKESALSEVKLLDEQQTAKLNKLLAEKEGEISQLKEKVEEISENEARLSELNQVLFNKESSIAEYKTLIEQCNKEKTASDEQLNWYYHYYIDTQSRLSEYDEMLKTLQSELEKSRQVESVSKGTSDEHELEIKHSEIVSLRAENERLFDLLKGKDIMIVEKEGQLQELEITVSKRDKEQAELQTKNIEIIEHVSGVESKLNQAEALIFELKSEKEKLNDELQMLKTSKEEKPASQEHSQYQELEREPVVVDQMSRINVFLQGTENPNVSLEASVLKEVPTQKSQTEQLALPPADMANISSDVKKLKALCKGKDAKIRKLEEKVSILSAKDLSSSTVTEVTVDKLSNIEATLIETQKGREKYLTECEHLKRVVQEQKVEISFLQSELNEFQNYEDSNKTEIERLNESCQLLSHDLEQSRKQIADNQSVVQRCHLESETFQKQAKEKEEQLTASLATLQNEISHMNLSMQDLDHKYKIVLQQNTESESVLLAKDEELHSLKQIMKDHMVQIDDLKKMNSLLQQNGEGAESEKLKFEELLLNEREEIQSLYEQMNQLVSEKLDIEVKLEQKERDLRTAADELRRFAADRDNLDELIEHKDDLQTEVETLNRDLAEIRRRLQEKMEQNNNSEKIIISKDQEIVTLSKEMELTRNHLRNVNENLLGLQQAYQDLEEHKNNITRELETKKEACSRLKGMYEEKEQLIQSLKLSVSDSTNEITTLTQKCSDLQEEIKLYKDQIKEQRISDEQAYSDKYLELSEKLEVLKSENVNSNVRVNELIIENNLLREIVKKYQLPGTQLLPALDQFQKTDEHCVTKEVAVQETEPESMQKGVYHQSEEEAKKSEEDVHLAKTEVEVSTNDIVTYQKQIADLEKQLESVEDKSKRKDEKVAFLLENMQEMEERLSQLTGNDENAVGIEEKLQVLEAEVSTLKRANEEKDLKFTKALATAKKIKLQLNEAKGSLEQERKEKADLARQLQDAKSNKNGQGSKEQEGVSTNQTMGKGEKEQTEKIISDLQSQSQTYAEFCQQLQEQIQDLTESFHGSEKTNKALQDKITEISVQHEYVKEVVNEKDEVIESLAAEATEFKQSLKNQVLALEEKAHMNALLQADLDEKISTIEALKQEFSSKLMPDVELQKKCEKLEVLLQESVQNIEELSRAISDERYEKEDKIQQVNELLEQNKSYEDTIQMLQHEIKGYAVQKSDMEQHVAILVQDREDLNKRLQEQCQVDEQNITLSNQVEDMKAVTENKDAEILKLQDEIAAVKQSMLMSEELMIQLNEKDTKLAHLTQNLEDVIQADSEREEQFKQMKKQVDLKDDENEHLHRDLKTANDKIIDLSTDIKSLQTEQKKLETTIENQDTIISKQSKQLDELMSKDNEIQVLSAKLDDFEMKTEENKNLQEQLQTMTIALEKTEMDNFELKDILKQINYDMEQLTLVNETLKKAKANFEEEKETFNEKLAEMVANEAVLKGNALVQQKEIEDLVDKNASLEVSFSKLEKDFESLNSSNQDFKIIESPVQSETEHLKNQLESLHAALEGSKSEKQNLFQDLNALQGENESLKTLVKKLENDVAQASSGSSETNEKLKELSEMIVQINDENNKLVGSFHATQSEVEERNKTIAELESQMLDVQKVVSQFQIDLDMLRNENEILRTESESAVKEKKDLQEQNIALKKELESSMKGKAYQSTEMEPEEAAVGMDYVKEPLIVEEAIQCESSIPVGNSTNHDAVETDIRETSESIFIESKQLQEELERVQCKYAELMTENDNLKAKNELHSGKFEKMLAKLKVFKEKNDAYQQDIVVLKQHLAANERSDNTQTEHLQHKCDILQDTVAQLEEKISKETGLLNNERETSFELQRERDRLQAQVIEIQESQEALVRDRDIFKKQYHELSEQTEGHISALKATCAQAQNKNIELLEEIDSLNSVVTEKEEKLNDLTAEKEDLEKRITSLVSEIFENRSKTTDQEQHVSHLRKKLHEAECKIEEITNEAEMARRQIVDSKEQYEMLEQDNENYQAVIQKIKTFNKELSEDNVRQKMKIEKLEEELNSSQSNLRKLEVLKQELSQMESEKNYAEEEMDGLREDVLTLKKEKEDAVLMYNQVMAQLDIAKTESDTNRNETESLKWRLEELESLEEELNFERRESNKLQQRNKDLENELLKAQQSLESLENEVRLQKGKVSDVEGKLEKSLTNESRLELSIAKSKEKDVEMDGLKEEIEVQQKAAVERINTLETNLKSLKDDLTESKNENASLKKQCDKANKQLQKLDNLKMEYETLNDEYNKVINDNSGLAKQIEELHTKLRDKISNGKEFDGAEKAHLEKEKSTLVNRIEQLEAECSDLRAQCAEMADSKSELEHSLQTIKFERDSLKAHQSAVSDGDRSSSFQSDYSRIQQQFNVAMQQKNKLQADLNLAQKSLSQREARCQQLAMQVSQLAEDRSFLNVQLGMLSKSLREKEQELPVVQKQYRQLYQAHTALQAKVAELEKKMVVDFIQRSPAPSSGSVTPVEGQPSRSHELKKRLEATVNEQQRLAKSNAELEQKTRQLEQVLEITLGDRLGEEQLRELETMDTTEGRVRDIQLTRDANSSLFGRLQRWMSLQSAVPPEHIERPVQ